VFTTALASWVDKGFCLINLFRLKSNPQGIQGAAMYMYFCDDTDDWPEYRIIKDEIHRLELAYIEFHKKLQQVESASTSDPANDDLKAKVAALQKKLKEIEKTLNESLSMYR